MTMPRGRRLARRLWGLRIFPDDQGLTNRSAEQLGLEVLVVSQFTLYADTSRGRRPSFTEAAPPEQAEQLVAASLTPCESSAPASPPAASEQRCTSN